MCATGAWWQGGGGAEWQQQRVKGSTPRQLLSVQIIVHSGEGAGAQPHARHEPQALRGLAQGEHQRGLLWQVLRFCGDKEKAAQKRFRLVLAHCTQVSLCPKPRSLAEGAGSAAPKSCQLRAAAAAANSPAAMTHPTAQQGL